LSRHQLHVLVRGELGNAAQFKSSYLKKVSVQKLVTRMLHELKAGCIVSHQFEAAMECCNLLLQWHSDDVHLNRERAFIAEQLGCIKVAAADLQHFIDNSPHDPVIELVKMQLKELTEHAEIYH
ncbi:MAG: tetratricopeptide repeat protein, partial [Shewanella sp.]